MRMSVLDRLRLARTDGIGPITFRRLCELFPDPSEAIANLPQIARKAGRATPLVVPSRDEASAELQALQRMGGRMVFLGDANYPQHLAELGDSPAVFAVLGDVALLGARSVAVVGARNASLNGKSLAGHLAGDLAAAGLVIVSGLARGIDAAAHEAALRNGSTIAVVAGGLDMPYPPEHAKLQARIATTGAVIAEAPLGTAPISRHFPRRNRIVAGLTLGVVVIEAALRSGSLITARVAVEAGREVFAVPGSPLDPRCRGSNDLLREGATLTETAEDVLQQLTSPRPRQPGFAEPTPPGLAPEPGPQELDMVTSLLGPDPCAVDDLIRDCQLPASTVLTVLADLELAGRLEMLPGARVALISGTDRPLQDRNA
jgi:DNA processing protein